MKNNLKKVFYVHGLEGSYKGLKGTYLSKKYEVVGIDMDIHIKSLSSTVNPFKSFAKTFFSKKIFSAFSKDSIVEGMIQDCVEIQKKFLLEKLKSESFDYFVASSWGGGVLLRLMDIPELIPYDQKILLLSTAHRKMLKDFKYTDNHKLYTNVKIVHSLDDEIVDVEGAKSLATFLNEGKSEKSAQLILLEKVSHRLDNIIKDYEKGSLFDYLENWSIEPTE